MKNNNIIFGNGNEFIEPAIPKKNPPPKIVYPRNYAEAKELIIKDLRATVNSFKEIPEYKRMDQMVFTVKTNKKFTAKSFDIKSLYRKIGLQKVGSRPIGSGEDLTKLDFVMGNPSNLEHFISKFDDYMNQTTEKEILYVDAISLISNYEIFKAVPKKWDPSYVEFVLHYFQDPEKAINKLVTILESKGKVEDVQTLIFDSSLIFVNAKITELDFTELYDFNPLRSVNPYTINEPKILSSFKQEPNKFAVEKGRISTLPKIGVIDGGVETKFNDFFSGLVQEKYHVNNNPSDKYIEHGTAVAGLIMYGDLTNLSEDVKLEPDFCIESIRGLPCGNLKSSEGTESYDYNMIEVVNLLKKAVPNQPEIDIYNISIGPVGPVIDDYISSFTLMIDKLAYQYNKLFFVAVGNTGAEYGLNSRIQSPSDSVNNIGVASYYIDSSGKPNAAEYNSIGLGREGAKIKPDFLEHGGNSSDMVTMLNSYDYLLNKGYGTSFATPLVARKAGLLMKESEDLDALTVRTLLIHESTNFDDSSDISYVGRGIVKEEIGDILYSEDNEFKIIYSGFISSRSYSKLEIPLPENLESKSYEFTWTVGVLTDINETQADSYTKYTVEDYFYPDSFKYSFKRDGKNKIVSVFEQEELDEALTTEGWTKPTYPNPAKNVKHLTESDLRKRMKWDTTTTKRALQTSKSLNRPFILLHGLNRDAERVRIKFCVVVTVRALNEAEPLYMKVQQNHLILKPIEIQNNLEVIL